MRIGVTIAATIRGHRHGFMTSFVCHVFCKLLTYVVSIGQMLCFLPESAQLSKTGVLVRYLGGGKELSGGGGNSGGSKSRFFHPRVMH